MRKPKLKLLHLKATTRRNRECLSSCILLLPIHKDMKTAIRPLNSGKTCLDANLHPDKGAQRSFITTKLANKLELVPSGRETLCISRFGESNKNIRTLPMTVFYLKTDKQIISMDVLIVPEIAVLLKTYAQT